LARGKVAADRAGRDGAAVSDPKNKRHASAQVPNCRRSLKDSHLVLAKRLMAHPMFQAAR